MCDNINENDVLFEEDELSKTRFDINIKDITFAIIFVVCSIIMSVFGIFGEFRAGFTAASLMILGAVTVYFKSKQVKTGVYPVICGLLALGLTAVFSITSNYSVRFWSFVVLALLSLIWFTSLVSKERAKGDLGIVKEIFSPIFRLAMPNLPNAIASLVSGEKSKTFGKVILGILLAIPVLFVVVPLLMSSDEAFSGMVSLAFENLALSIVKIILGLILSIFLIAYCISLKKKELPQIKSSNFKGLESAPTISFLSVLSICYLSYLLSQLAYFFSAFSGFLPANYIFSVSAYARRGFFEMSVIAAINFVIIFAVLLLSRKKNGKINIASRTLSTFIGLFTLLIIATALSKMFLYIGELGMTELRITTSVFMIFLAVVFITLLIRLYVPTVKVIKTGFVAAAICLIVLGTVNVNSVIAGYNYYAYKNNILDDIDVSTIYYIGDEGVPYLAKLADDENKTIARLAKENLFYCFEDYYEAEYNYQLNKLEVGEKKYKGIGEFSFARSRAYEVLDDVMQKQPQILNYNDEYYDYRY